ncbi:MAG: hypothetical protein GWO02_04335, partial [Gammaproteobacteria bacterium]|nr:hypothetical protein [Gammaproteobacteria bacterium]
HTTIVVVLQVIVVAAAVSLGIGLLVLYRLHVRKLPVERGSMTARELFDTAAPLWTIVMIN